MRSIQKVMVIGGIITALTFNTVEAMAATYSAIYLTNDAEVKVVTGGIPTIEKEGVLAPITISERYGNTLTTSKSETDRTITLSLKGTRYRFATEKPKVTYTGGFRNMDDVDISYEKINGKEDPQVLKIILPYDKGGKNAGGLQITNLKVVADSVKEGKLELQISGALNEITDIVVAEVKAYGAKLEAVGTTLKNVIAGDTNRFSFSLTEGMPDSLIPGRSIEFTLSKGYFYTENNEVCIGSILLNGRDISNKVEISNIEDEEGKVTGFEFVVPPLDTTQSNTITFKNVLLYADVTQKGEVVLNMEGRGVDKGDRLVIGEIEAPVTTKVKVFNAKVGVKGQVGGHIAISETSKGMFEKGYITLEIEEQDGITFRSEPDVEVTEGNLKVSVVGWDKQNPNLFKLRVTQKSTEASTIEISNFKVNVSEIVPDGTYGLKIGGSAISPEGEGTLEFANFLTTKYEAAPDCPANGNISHNNGNNNSKKTITKFTLGSSTYTINEETRTMDGMPYVENGRTMVPLRYAVAAAGVNPDDVEFSNGVITIPASKLIKMTLGSSTVTADGKESTMVTAAKSVNGRTYVPISEIAKILDLTVGWDKETKTATFEY